MQYPANGDGAPSDEAPLPITLPPKLSPRLGTHPVHSNPAVQAYHQNLSSHLHSLLRSASAGAHPLSAALKPVALAETGRKESDESLPVTEGSLLESGSGNVESSGLTSSELTTLTEEVSSLASEARGESEDVEVLEDGDDEEEPQQLTARPELNPRTSLMDVPLGQTPKAHSATSSNSSNQRRALASSREEELQLAWKAEGKRVFRAMPDGFMLKMGREASGSAPQSETSRSRRRSHLRANGVGLGIELGSDPAGIHTQLEGMSIGRTASRGTTHSGLTGGSTYSKSPEPPTSSSFLDTAAATAASTVPDPSRPRSRQDKPLRDVASYDEKEEYEAKRLHRLEKKRGELERRIREWYAGVLEVCTEEDNREIFLSEVIPTPLSPRRVKHHPPPTLAPLPPTHTSLPFSNKAHSFSTKQQPLFVIPPTPDIEKPSSIFEPPQRSKSSGGVDLGEKLRALEALMGTPESLGRPVHSELSGSSHLGDATIRGRRRIGEMDGLGRDGMDLKTPRVGSGARESF